jgi:hypothetical protein
MKSLVAVYAKGDFLVNFSRSNLKTQRRESPIWNVRLNRLAAHD